MAEQRHKISLDEAMVGLLALQIADREERTEQADQPRRTEVLLAEAGLTVQTIATLTSKKVDTVRKIISRAKPSDGGSS